MAKYVFKDFELPEGSVKEDSYVGIKLIGVLNHQSTWEFVDIVKSKLEGVKGKRCIIVDATEVTHIHDFAKLIANSKKVSKAYMNLKAFDGIAIITNKDYINAMVGIFTLFGLRKRIKACKRVDDAIAFVNGKSD